MGCLKHDVKVPFAQAFDEAQNRVMLRFITVGWELEDMLSPVGARHRKNIKIIREFGMNIIQQRRRDIEMGQAKNRNDLLTLLMTMQNNSGDNSAATLSDEQLCDYVLNFIIAGECLLSCDHRKLTYSFAKISCCNPGRDTTAVALAWTVYLLEKNPHVKAQLLEEIDSTLGTSTTPTYDQIKNMPYANACFHETLRLYPSVPNELKEANADDVLPGIFLKKTN